MTRESETEESAKRRNDDMWRRKRAPTPMARLLDRLTRPVLGKRGFAAASIIARWPEIVGVELSRFALPLEVKFPRGRTVATVVCWSMTSLSQTR